jgi:hypothetical protein
MNKDQITDRIALLFLALQFCSEQMRMFSVGERIMINQERCQWMHLQSYPQAEPRPVSEKIEAKIKDTVRLIGVYDFRPMNQDPFKEESEN